MTQAQLELAHRILEQFVISRDPDAKVNIVSWSRATPARDRIQEWLDTVARGAPEFERRLDRLARHPDRLPVYREARASLAGLLGDGGQLPEWVGEALADADRLGCVHYRYGSERIGAYRGVPDSYSSSSAASGDESDAAGRGVSSRPDPDGSALPSLAVVIPFRAARGDRGRLRNCIAAVRAVAEQEIPRDAYRIVVVEQDREARGARYLEGLVDDYVAVRNPGAFNKSWAMNIGFDRSGGADLLCFLDADSLVEPGFLGAVRARMAAGVDALVPFTELVFLDRRSSVAAIRRRLKPRPGGRAARGGPGDELDREERAETELRGFALRDVRGFAVCVTRDRYLRCDGFDERFRGWGDEDNEFWRQLLRTGGVERGKGELLHLWHRRPVMADANLVRPNKHIVGTARTPSEVAGRGRLDKYAHEPDSVAQVDEGFGKDGDNDEDLLGSYLSAGRD